MASLPVSLVDVTFPPASLVDVTPLRFEVALRCWTRTFALGAAALALLSSPLRAIDAEHAPAEHPPAKKSAKPAKPNKERTAKPKARENATFKKAKSCGAAQRTCLAKCHGSTTPAAHTACVKHAQCDHAYSTCMGKAL